MMLGNSASFNPARRARLGEMEARTEPTLHRAAIGRDIVDAFTFFCVADWMVQVMDDCATKGYQRRSGCMF